MNLIRYIFTCSIILLLYSCFASMSMEFNSARTYARIEDNLVEAEKWALKAMEVEPDNSAVPWFLANEVYRPLKKTDKIAEMYKEALKRTNSDLEKPEYDGEKTITTVHGAIRNEAESIYNNGVSLLKRGRKNKAISKFLFSMSLNPNLIENYIILSDIEYENNNIDQAVKYIEQATAIDPDNIELNFEVVKFAKLNKNYDLAISKLKSMSTEDQALKLMIDREIFKIYLDTENYDEAINFGTVLVDGMLENTDIDDLVLSEVSYNLAIFNREKGAQLYESVQNVNFSTTDDQNIIQEAIQNANQSIEYLSAAKERFYDASSFNPDDKQSIKYAKELTKLIKNLKRNFIPSLEKRL